MATIALILKSIIAIVQFPKELKWFIELLFGTPKEKREAMIGKIKEASKLADDGDTSGYEKIISS